LWASLKLGRLIINGFGIAHDEPYVPHDGGQCDGGVPQGCVNQQYRADVMPGSLCNIVSLVLSVLHSSRSIEYCH